MVYTSFFAIAMGKTIGYNIVKRERTAPDMREVQI